MCSLPTGLAAGGSSAGYLVDGWVGQSGGRKEGRKMVPLPPSVTEDRRDAPVIIVRLYVVIYLCA